MMPLQIYLKQGGQANRISHTDNTVISIIYSFTYTNTSVRIHWLYQMWYTEVAESEFSFKQGIYTANCGLLTIFMHFTACVLIIN